MRPRRAELRITDPATHPRRYVSLQVAAEYLEVHPMTLRKYLTEGLIPFSWFGRRRRIEVVELAAFEQRQRVKSLVSKVFHAKR